MLVAQCPNCGTAFKVSLSELGVASGQLQCGQCQALFHAEDPIKTNDEIEAFTPQRLPPDTLFEAEVFRFWNSWGREIARSDVDLWADLAETGV